MTIRLIAVVAAVMMLITNAANADTVCTEKTVRDRLAAMLDEFNKPAIRARLDAAKNDLDTDGDFDNEEDAMYLMLVAAWHEMDRNLHAGADAACEVMMKHDAMIKSVLGI